MKQNVAIRLTATTVTNEEGLYRPAITQGACVPIEYWAHLTYPSEDQAKAVAQDMIDDLQHEIDNHTTFWNTTKL